MKVQQRFELAVPVGKGRHSFIEPRVHYDHPGIGHRISLVIPNRALDDEPVVGFMGRQHR